MGEKRKIQRKRYEEIAGTCRKYLFGPVRNFGDSVDSCPGPGGEPVKKMFFALNGRVLLIAWGCPAPGSGALKMGRMREMMPKNTDNSRKVPGPGRHQGPGYLFFAGAFDIFLQISIADSHGMLYNQKDKLRYRLN